MGLEDELPASAPKPGTILADRYRIERALGVGGVGYVMAATHVHLQEPVAIKMLHPALARDAEMVARFLREGRAAVKIKSEHVARVLDVAELPDHTPYLVMELLDGSDLAQVLERRGTIDIAQAVDWLLQACEAIAEAHALEIVHRDLKPANLFIARSRTNGAESVKVLDFGISKMSGAGDGNLAMTKTSAVLGSPLYMSPEQLRSSRNVDARTDIWALGVILFELVSGGPPFVAESLAELSVLVLSTDAPRLARVRPEVPKELSDIVATCLQRRSEDRFANLADLADRLAPFGTARARESAETIVRTLGMPAARAVPPANESHLVLPARGAAGDPNAVTLAQSDGPMVSAAQEVAGSRRPRTRLVAGLLGLFLFLGGVGSFAIYRARLASHAYAAAATSVAPAAPSIAAVASAEPASPTASVASASAEPSARSSGGRAATGPRVAKPRDRSGTRSPSGVSETPAAATAPLKTPSPSEIATSAKD
jgi:serine/threonine-protein kinase